MAEPTPLVVLICVPERAASRRLYLELSSSARVERVVEVGDVTEASVRLAERDFGLVIVDSGARGAMAAGGLVTRAREKKAVVVLLRDTASTEVNGVAGHRVGREGFPILDRGTPDELLPDVLDELLSTAQEAREPSAGLWSTEAVHDAPSPTPQASARAVEKVPSTVVSPDPVARRVFLSYRFAEESGYVQGLRLLLTQRGFEVVTGRGAEGSVSAAVLRRIRDSDAFLALMTRHRPIAEPAGTWTTSSWLIEEKGAALAFGKRIVLLLEEGIIDIGGLQGDWQRNVFTPQTFMAAALEAVRQLEADGEHPQ